MLAFFLLLFTYRAHLYRVSYYAFNTTIYMNVIHVYFFFSLLSLSNFAVSWALNMLLPDYSMAWKQYISWDVTFAQTSSQELICLSIQSVSKGTVLVNFRNGCTKFKKQNKTKRNQTKRYETKITKCQAEDEFLLNFGCRRNFKLRSTDKIWNVLAGKWFTFAKLSRRIDRNFVSTISPKNHKNYQFHTGYI